MPSMVLRGRFRRLGNHVSVSARNSRVENRSGQRFGGSKASRGGPLRCCKTLTGTPDPPVCSPRTIHRHDRRSHRGGAWDRPLHVWTMSLKSPPTHTSAAIGTRSHARAWRSLLAKRQPSTPLRFSNLEDRRFVGIAGNRRLRHLVLPSVRYFDIPALIRRRRPGRRLKYAQARSLLCSARLGLRSGGTGPQESTETACTSHPFG